MNGFITKMVVSVFGLILLLLLVRNADAANNTLNVLGNVNTGFITALQGGNPKLNYTG